jgi:hypothetical protein
MGRLIDTLKDRDEQADRAYEKGVINPDTGASLILGKSGNVTVASSHNVQYKLNYASGTAREMSFQSDTITNRKNLKIDEILINGHKLNPQLYELTDMKQLYHDPNYAIGNLTVNATVLVKAWEPSLEKWVLIRRPIRTPVFMDSLGIPRAHEDMALNDNITSEIDMTSEM